MHFKSDLHKKNNFLRILYCKKKIFAIVVILIETLVDFFKKVFSKDASLKTRFGMDASSFEMEKTKIDFFPN